MSKEKNEKKIEEKIEPISEDTEEEKIEEAKLDDAPVATEEIKVAIEEASGKINQKAISKKVAITRFLTRQGLGQNAIKETFVLFEEYRKIKCKKTNYC